MNKPFLLIAGHQYYPSGGTKDWQGRFETREEIETQIVKVPHHSYYTKGKNKTLGILILGMVMNLIGIKL